ncbi:glycerol-3-phosphate acyltransferase [Ancylothrix sp. C2]|nr:glycerol-3-phosphate acyltransferase [Ancylothrix sp. D3o]
MTLTQVWGLVLILLVCPILGGLPLIAWIVKFITGQNLKQIGTGNISVSAAFFHGGKTAGILAVVSEAAKGILAVLLTRMFFLPGSAWELVALMALVLGRYFIGKGAGTTNVVWGVLVHSPKAAIFVFLITGVTFTLIREKNLGKLASLVIFPVVLALFHPYEGERVATAVLLSLLLALIYKMIPDDLNLPATSGQEESQKMFRFFQGNKAILTLDRPLETQKAGQKAANLSQLKSWGYPVPQGWILPAGDDPQPLLDWLQPNVEKPLVVRSSAIGEDSEKASAAGQYESILNITNKQQLQDAITRCFSSYNSPAAQAYRRDRQLPENSMAVVIQQQIKGVFSGVAFSRDPINSSLNSVVIEALPGDCNRIVSGQFTPEQYRVFVPEIENVENWKKPENLELIVEGEGDIPPALIQEVAYLARHIEAKYHGIPQDIEWSYDGDHLWLLQARPVTTLFPLWTRKIAAEVIPGLIRPLTWSINRPLTCGVWGDIFKIVLAESAANLDFNQTATLHYSRAYFNATLLGEIFLKMGLPAESLEFLTRGAKFTKPPLSSTFQQLPGLLRLLKQEWNLEKDFQRDYDLYFRPAQAQLANSLPTEPLELLQRIDAALEALKKATYYSIFSPLSYALRQGIFKVNESDLDNSQLPEVAAVRSLQNLANSARRLLPNTADLPAENEEIFALLARVHSGKNILEKFEEFLEHFGYLSDVATDIAVPRWKETPEAVLDLLAEYIRQPTLATSRPAEENWKTKIVQRRLNLKGQVTAIYSQFLAELRALFLALENVFLNSGFLAEKGDIFYLEFAEIRQLVVGGIDQEMNLDHTIEMRKNQLENDRNLTNIPFVVYGNMPPVPVVREPAVGETILRGIGASPGIVEAKIKVVRQWRTNLEVDRQTIVVVPYTDAGWGPLLARAGGIISEVGGRLSHGAIVAREYGIPAVMDVPNAMECLQDGQQVRIDGSAGIVEVINDK